MLALGLVGANKAHATLSPYPSSGYPQTNTSGTIHTIAISGNTVYLGGTFLTAGGEVREKLAAIDASANATS